MPSFQSMAESWVIVLEKPSADPCVRVGGLPLALRLGLDAQAAGASAVVVADGEDRARAALDDARLRLPVLDAVPDAARVIRVPANTVVHRATFKTLLGDEAREHDLAVESVKLDAAYAFAPIDVVDRSSARRAESALFRSLRKPQDGWTSRWLNRYVSLAISKQLVKTPLWPNQLSILILAVGLTGAWLASRGGYWDLVAGAFLFQMQSLLDGCDGEMSRVTHRGSHAGEWLDTIGDDLTNYAFFAGAAWGLAHATGHTLYLAAGAVMVFCGVLASGIEYRYLISIGSGDLLRYPLSASSTSGQGPLSFIQPLFKRDTFVMLTFLAAVIDCMGPMLILFSFAAVGILVSVIATELRMRRHGSPLERDR
jgi:phosphatidylglycerophosphate synthase